MKAKNKSRHGVKSAGGKFAPRENRAGRKPSNSLRHNTSARDELIGLVIFCVGAVMFVGVVYFIAMDFLQKRGIVQVNVERLNTVSVEEVSGRWVAKSEGLTVDIIMNDGKYSLMTSKEGIDNTIGYSEGTYRHHSEDSEQVIFYPKKTREFPDSVKHRYYDVKLGSFPVKIWKKKGRMIWESGDITLILPKNIKAVFDREGQEDYARKSGIENSFFNMLRTKQLIWYPVDS